MKQKINRMLINAQLKAVQKFEDAKEVLKDNRGISEHMSEMIQTAGKIAMWIVIFGLGIAAVILLFPDLIDKFREALNMK